MIFDIAIIDKFYLPTMYIKIGRILPSTYKWLDIGIILFNVKIMVGIRLKEVR